MDLSAFDLKGKVALITGGAHGIGFSIAEGMAKCGATICFNCSSEASLEKGMAAYKAAGIDAHGYAADVSDEDAVNAMVAKIKAEVGPVDILVNNAGLMKRVPMVEMSHADFMRVIDVHVGGAFNCSKAVLPDMMEKHEGKIINICSMMSELGRETRTSPPSTASTTSSATAWVRAISPPPRPPRCVRSSPTAAVTPSTSSSPPRPRRAAGATRKIWSAPASSWPPTPPTS